MSPPVNEDLVDFRKRDTLNRDADGEKGVACDGEMRPLFFVKCLQKPGDTSR